MQNKLILVIVAVVVVFGGLFLMNNRPMTTVPTEPQVMEKPTIDSEEAMEDLKEPTVVEDSTDTSMMVDPNVKTFEVGGGGFYFDPAEIKVMEGDTVKIVFTNEGGMHDWVIDEFDARTPILKETDEKAEITFVADKAGTFEYYCSVGSHRANGMVGNLIVEPKN